MFCINVCVCVFPVRCTRLCPHSLDKEDGVERQGPVTLNPRHMRKAFKVMNELRRWFVLSAGLFVLLRCRCNLQPVSRFISSVQPEPVVWCDYSCRGCRDCCSQGGSGCREPLFPRHVYRYGPSSVPAALQLGLDDTAKKIKRDTIAAIRISPYRSFVASSQWLNNDLLKPSVSFINQCKS